MCTCPPQPDLEAERCPSEDGSKVQSFKGSTALLFELEDKIAQAAADVQNAQSEVWGHKRYILNKKEKKKQSEDLFKVGWSLEFVLEDIEIIELCASPVRPKGLLHRGQDCCTQRRRHAG